ncbi:MAG TPA: cytochrome P450 [Acidimicrobiales bacterium]|nr:cytochrome P450 [Acidimicrobiales bacterium]
MVHYDPFSVEAMADPFPRYRELRAAGAVHRLEQYDAWALPRFAEVWEVAQDREHFSIVEGPVFTHERLTQHNDGPPVAAATEPLPSFASLDPPLHTALRQRMFASFTPRSCRDLAGEVESMVQTQLDALDGRDRFDVIADFAGPVAVASTLRFLGLPLDDAPTLGAWVNASTRREPGTPGRSADAQHAATALHAYLTDVVTARRSVRARAAAADDVAERLLDLALPDGRHLTDAEIAVQLSTLLVGGGETLPKIVAGGLVQLATHPDQRADLHANPTLLPNAFEEMLRLEGVLQFVGRTLTCDTAIGGQPMRAGQRVLLLLQSANRDEREFDDPDRFSIHRKIERQVGFGHGVHFCIGAHPARLTGIALLRALLARYPGVEPQTAEGSRPPSEFQLGWTRLPVTV